MGLGWTLSIVLWRATRTRCSVKEQLISQRQSFILFRVYRFHSFWSALFSQIHLILLSVFDTKLTMYFFYFQKSECQKVCVHIIINLKCIIRQSYHDIESPCSSSYIHVQHVLPSAFSPLLPCCTVFCCCFFFFLKDELPLMVSLQEQRWCVRLDLVLHL